MPLHHLPARFRPSTLAACLHGALCLHAASAALTLLAPPALAQTQAQIRAQAATPEVRAYRIGAGPLDDTLNRFARQAGITLSFTPQQVAGLRSRGLDGNFSVEAGLAALLNGTGRVARAQAPGHYVLQAPEPATRDVFAPTSTPGAAGAQAEATLPVTTVTAVHDRRQEVYDTPGSVSVITREDIDRLPPRNTSDVLADVPGLYTSQSRQNPGVSVNMRGLQDFGRVNVMIDGTRQNYQQSGHGSNGAVYIDPELLSGVDISKGPTSTSGGAAMIAGMVNFRTLETGDLLKEDQRFGGRINATRGSNAYDFAGSAAIALRPNDDLDLVMALGRKSVGEFEKGRRGTIADDMEVLTHGTSRLSSQDQSSALFKANWRFLPDHELKLSYIGMDARFDEGGSTDVAGGDVTTHNHIRNDTLLANHRWRPSDMRWVDLQSSLYTTRTSNSVMREAGTLDTNQYRLRYETRTVGGSVQNTARLPGQTFDTILKTGTEFFQDRTDPEAQALTAGADAGTTALYTGSTPAGKRTVMSLFGESTFLYQDWLELAAGLRYDWYGLQGDGLMRVGSITNPAGVRPSTTAIYTAYSVDRHDGAWAPRVSAAVKPTSYLQLFTSYGQGLRPPALTESLLWGSHTGSLFPYYPNPALRAERSRNLELGANLNFDNVLATADKLRMKAALFQNKVENYITLARVMSPISTTGSGLLGPYAYMNMNDPFKSKGFELQADYDAGVVFGALNFTRMIIDTGTGGYDPFPLGSLTGFPATTLGQQGNANIWYVLPPRRNLSLSGGVRLLDRKLTLGLRMRMQSPASNTSVWLSDMYNGKSWRVHDFWASYEVNPNVTLRLAINNLRDVNYSEMNGNTYWVAPGRTALATLSVKF
ncbi:MAG: TonB-dependent hemoglobin/transferrin/lactoferrin family receptor [Pseudomonadota bacterium]